MSATAAPDSTSHNGPDTAADAGSLYQDALEVAIGLKTKHAACYSADPKGFSRVIRKANAAAFRRKPGPAPDPRIVQAALEHAGGAKWSDLYPRYIIGYERLKELNPATCDDAEAGFRRKVHDYLSFAIILSEPKHSRCDTFIAVV